MTKTSTKVGMIGAGFILKSHAQSVSALDGCVLHAVADSSEHRAAEAARQFGFAKVLTSVEEMAISDCDVVHVLVPPFLHLEIAQRLLEEGKSVFLEKPMGLSSEECRRLGAIADARGLRLGINHNFLFLPGYERLRSAIADRKLGRVDHITCNWNVFLPQLRSGPFDAWMLSAPANIFFELGPHLGAFILDLLGGASISAAVADDAVELQSGQQAYRSWSVIGREGPASFSLSVSVRSGQSDRILRVRASGGSTQLDFGRDILWEERTRSANPIFDAVGVSRRISREAGLCARRDRRRRMLAVLRKLPSDSSWGESMFNSIASYYRSDEVDQRQHWRLGASVVEFCENVCAAAGVGAPSTAPIVIAPPAARSDPTVLVVGGTGFIGRRLVEQLIQDGASVRVLSRSRNAAAIALAGLPVDIQGGSFGDPAVARMALQGIELVYHLGKCDGQKWADYVRGDIEPTKALAEVALAANVKRFIYTGTIDSYDSGTAGKKITGETPLDQKIGSRNNYARSKAACEAVLRRLADEKGLPLVVVRPAIVIGPGSDPAHIGVANFTSESEVQYWGRGDNRLPLVLVQDVADALVRAGRADNVTGKTFLLTSEPMLTAKEYIHEFGTHAGVNVRAVERSPWRFWLADLVKEVAKNLVRHPNRRWSTLHDWQCRTQLGRYDSSETRRILGWQPVQDRETLIQKGIVEAIEAVAGSSCADMLGRFQLQKRRSA
jgi:predicted dehydrogenase/nucleoside-diphosphate-sugar epimerase